MSMDFAEKYGPWGIVCGGSDGIGAAFARALASRGINLVLVARREDVLEAFAKEVLVMATDTPSLHRALAASGGYQGDLANPDDVATTALDHLADGPTWMCGGQDPLGPPPLGSVTRRAAVLRMSRR